MFTRSMRLFPKMRLFSKMWLFLKCHVCKDSRSNTNTATACFLWHHRGWHARVWENCHWCVCHLGSTDNFLLFVFGLHFHSPLLRFVIWKALTLWHFHFLHFLFIVFSLSLISQITPEALHCGGSPGNTTCDTPSAGGSQQPPCFAPTQPRLLSATSHSPFMLSTA